MAYLMNAFSLQMIKDFPMEVRFTEVNEIPQGLISAVGHQDTANVLGVPIAAGILYPFFGILLSPMIAALAMSMSSVSVIVNALRLRSFKL